MSKLLPSLAVMIADANRISGRTLQRQLAAKPNITKAEVFDHPGMAQKAISSGGFNCLFIDVFSLGIDTGTALIQFFLAKIPEAPICLYSESSSLITMPDVSEYWRKRFGHYAKLSKDQLAQGIGDELDMLLAPLANHLAKTASRRKTSGLLTVERLPAPKKTGGLLSAERPPAPKKTGGLATAERPPAPKKTGGLPALAEQPTATKKTGGLPATAEQPPTPKKTGGLATAEQPPATKKTGALRRGTGKLAADGGETAKSAKAAPLAVPLLPPQSMLAGEAYGLEIVSPQPGAITGPAFEVRGTYKFLPAGQHLWVALVAKREILNPATGGKLVAKKYWPQKEATTRDGIEWQALIEEAGTPGTPKILLICVVGRNGQVVFDYFRQVTRETQELLAKLKAKGLAPGNVENPAPLLELTDDVVECAMIHITL